MTVYRFVRGTLAALAGTALVLFAGWHVLVWRMGCVYRAEGGVTTRKAHR